MVGWVGMEDGGPRKKIKVGKVKRRTDEHREEGKVWGGRNGA